MARSLVQLTALLVLGVLIGNAFADEPESIVGGHDAYEGEFPYQVSLRLGKHHVCGGSIISDRYILTAAHCVDGIAYPPFYDFTVTSGTISLTRGGQSHRIKHVQMHREYLPHRAQSWKNDIAIITLATPMTFNRFQQPIALATEDPGEDVALTLSGWGLLKAAGNTPDTLQKVTVFSMSNKACQARQYGQPIHNSHLCTISPRGIGACQGDSGGPLVYKKKQVGVVSWVFPCARGIPDVYSRVTSFLPFIRDLTGIY